MALIATADDGLRQLLASSLRDAEFDVSEKSRLADIAPDSTDFSLILIDTDFWPAESLRLLRKLRQGACGYNTAIIIISHTNSLEAYDAGVDMVLTKPISVPLFMARVRSVMRRYGIRINTHSA